jgi:NAD-dependent dihydropyrimidine dehydrogenase PreA subunit
MANHVVIADERCKACRLCIETCPTHSLEQGSHLNKSGYQFTRFVQNGCTACGLCFYMCPEPEAITVIKDDGKGGE